MIEILKIALISFMFCGLGTEGMIFEPYQKLIRQLPDWIRKPIGGCYICFTGQVCLWFYLIKYFNVYNPVDHLFFISAGIMSAMVYHKIYCLLK